MNCEKNVKKPVSRGKFNDRIGNQFFESRNRNLEYEDVCFNVIDDDVWKIQT